MTYSANIVGAGIAGPAAALTLNANDYNVNVYDARPADELHSDGILGITPENWETLTLTYDVYLKGVELMNSQMGKGTDYKHSLHYITWTDLHNQITERARRNGVQFHYAEKIDTPLARFTSDLLILATGVGSAKEVSQGTYTGYVVARGLAYQFSGKDWEMIDGEGDYGHWIFAMGDTHNGASVTMFIPRTQVQMRTTYSAVAPGEIHNLPPRQERLAETVPIWQFAPLSDWTVPEKLLRYDKIEHRPVIRIGDANGQIRPSTSMGANLGMSEAFQIPAMLESDTNNVERFRIWQRKEWTEEGQWQGF